MSGPKNRVTNEDLQDPNVQKLCKEIKCIVMQVNCDLTNPATVKLKQAEDSKSLKEPAGTIAYLVQLQGFETVYGAFSTRAKAEQYAAKYNAMVLKPANAVVIEMELDKPTVNWI